MTKAAALVSKMIRPERQADAVLHVEIARPIAKVMVLPGRFRDNRYIRKHVVSVLTMDAARGEQHIRANLRLIRRKLEAIGLDDDTIDREMRDIEARVRAELWRQVLLPGGDDR